MASASFAAPLKGSVADLPSPGGSGGSGSPTHADAAASAAALARRRRLAAAGKVAALVALGAGIALAVALPVLLPAARANSAAAAAAAGEPSSLLSSTPLPAEGARREVFLQAEPLVGWRFNPAPKGADWDGCHAERLAPGTDAHLTATGGPLGPTSTKAVWRAYSDASFTQPLEHDAHLGLLGPTLHAEVGDALVVAVRNALPFPVNFEAGGLALATGGGGPPALNPNDTATLTWRVPESAGPTGKPSEGDDAAGGDGGEGGGGGGNGGGAAATRPWLYRSTLDQVAHAQAGLSGVLAIAARGGLDPDTGKPKGVDREFAVLMQAFKEDMSPFYARDAAAAARRLLLVAAPAPPPPASKNGTKAAPLLPPRTRSKADARHLAAIEDAEAAGDDAALAAAATAALVARGGNGRAELDGGEDALLTASTKHGVNGFLYCSIPGLDMVEGERVRWYVAALGSEEALHTAHWHGVVLQGAESARRADQVVVQAAEVKALDAAPADNVGKWLLHCHLDDHMMLGMMATFSVLPKGGSENGGDGGGEGGARRRAASRRALRASSSSDAAPDGGRVREHFIAAEAAEWDYAPFGGEMCTGSLQPFGEGASVFLGDAPDRLGRKYLKARYFAYTDATFAQRVRVGPEWEHLGLVGPVLRAEVGDLLRVTFLNRVDLSGAASAAAAAAGENGTAAAARAPLSLGPLPRISMHPHGVLYDKSSEGALYADGSTPDQRKDDAVPPGERVVYEWRVPERSGPGPGDPSSVFWLYHSHTSEATDHHAGLFGGIIVTRQGLANDDLTPKDVDREFVLGFTILDELKSFMLDANVARSASIPRSTKRNETALSALLSDDPDFAESNLKHAVNGFMYCNLPGFEMRRALPSRVHFFALGGGSDMHTPTSAEVTAFLSGHRRQALQLLPGAFYSTDVTPPVAGQGMLQCAVADHVSGGMSALFSVTAEGGGPGPDANAAAAAPVRTFYVAAEPVDWDYAPLGSSRAGGTTNGCPASGAAPLTEDERVFTVTNAGGVGSRYRKARFVLYEDADFAARVPGNGYSVGEGAAAAGGEGAKAGPVVPEGWTGLTGPLLSAEEGDKIVVHFLNRLPFDASVHPSGGFVSVGNRGGGEEKEAKKPAAKSGAVSKPAAAPAGSGRRRRLLITAGEAAGEAAVAAATSSLSSDAGVAPGGKRRYEWLVPVGAGPGPNDGDVVAYSYSSGAAPIAHANAGLVGPVLVYATGKMPPPQQQQQQEQQQQDAAAATTDGGGDTGAGKSSTTASASAALGSAERPLVLPLYLAVMNEMGSPFFEANVAAAEKSAGGAVDRGALTFPESNLMHQANGYLYCNQPGLLTLPLGTRVRWVVFGFGSETDMHSPVFAGQTVTSPLAAGGAYTVGLMPASTAVIDMEATATGSWEAYCAVTDHYFAGMRVRMLVV